MRKRYQVGDLAMTEVGEKITPQYPDMLLVEVLEKHLTWYRARFAGMDLDPDSGLFRVRPQSETYGGVPRKNMKSIEGHVDLESLKEWQRVQKEKRAQEAEYERGKSA